MTPPVIVAHYHELWLKGRNRRFFLGKLAAALRNAFEGIPVERIHQPGDRFVIRLAEGADVQQALDRMRRVMGVVNYAVAMPVQRDMDAICEAACKEVASVNFSTFAVRASRSDKSFPHNSMQIESAVGRYLLDRLRAAGRTVGVKLDDPELTCRVEITPGPALVYARRIPGTGGLPANTGGRMMCLLSGGYDSSVAAFRMMKRGAHLSFVHFFGTGAQPGDSSVHVVRELARTLIAYQFSGKLFLVPFEAIQREIVRYAPESVRILLYRRMMARIAERLAHREHCLALLAGDSLGQVASQTLQNMVAVGAAVKMPIFRPLAGTDKLEIMEIARQIGTYDISSEPFHDCCPVFLPRNPELYASSAGLEDAEAKLDIRALVKQGFDATKVERYQWSAGRVERVEIQEVRRRASEPDLLERSPVS